MTAAQLNDQVKRWIPVAKNTAWRLCRQFRPSVVDRDRVISASMFAIVKALNTFDPTKAKLQTWIIFICRRACLDSIRDQIGRTPEKARPTPASASAYWLDDPDRHPIAPDFQDDDERIEEMIARARLTKREEKLVRARFIRGLRTGEAGRELGISTGRAYSHLSNALAKMRKSCA